MPINVNCHGGLWDWDTCPRAEQRSPAETAQHLSVMLQYINNFTGDEAVLTPQISFIADTSGTGAGVQPVGKDLKHGSVLLRYFPLSTACLTVGLTLSIFSLQADKNQCFITAVQQV